MKTSPKKNGLIRVGSAKELKAKGMKVVAGEQRPIVVIHHGGKIHALDNRCPHMGFPLNQGSVADGILTCHWHHARFDLASGGTFDLWADDVPTCRLEVRDGVVWVDPRCQFPDEARHWQSRLREGLAQSISLIIGKAVLGWRGLGADDRELVREAALFGARHRDGWSSGLTILTALANLAPVLPGEESYLALFHGISHVAGDCAGQPPRRDRQPLPRATVPRETLERWLRYWTLVRHRDAAERTLLTAIAGGASPAELAKMLLVAATDRYYADVGHALDSINKAFECLDLIGWEHAAAVLPTVVRQLVGARGGEELNQWRHPVDLVPLLTDAFQELPALLARDRGDATWRGHRRLARVILGDDPRAIVAALGRALGEGAAPTELSRVLAYAAAMRIARFGTANEYRDWITALHVFTYCNALHQSLRRLAAALPLAAMREPVRGIYHGALAIYLERFLNVPPASLPGERAESLNDLPRESDAVRAAFLETLNTQQQVERAGQLVARHLALGHPADRLVGTLARAVLREDANFHTYQMLEAGVQQHREWGERAEGGHILVAVARYLAAHSPTERAWFQTATIAQRLHRGEAIHKDPDPTADVPSR